MDLQEIEKKMAAFKASFQSEKTPETVVPITVYEEPVAQEQVATSVGGPCFSKCFKELIASLDPNFVGQGTKDTVLFLLDPANSNIPECEVVS